MDIRNLLIVLLVLIGSGFLIFSSWRNFEEVNKLDAEIEYKRHEVELAKSEFVQRTKQAKGFEAMLDAVRDSKARQEALNKDIQLLSVQKSNYKLYGWVCAIIGLALPIGYFALRRAASKYSAVEP